MKRLVRHFMVWLLGLTTIMRYFVIALLAHVALVVVLGSIKIVAIVPKIVASFAPAPLPPPSDEVPDDPFAAYREFDYTGPAMGAGGGLGGKGPGGTPTAGGENRSASIAPVASVAENAAVNEVIGVFSDSATAIARPSVGPSGVGMAPVGGLGDITAGTGGVKGPGGGIIGARMGPQRAVNLNKFGGSQATERAVLAALRWLKANQKPDGSWEMPHDPAGTALAALCFLGHGENADSAEFGATVSKALEHLVKSVGAKGDVRGSMYVQGLVTLALAEGFMLTQAPTLREPLEKAGLYITQAQKSAKQNAIHKGGWHYAPNSDAADVSVSGWVFMGLKSAVNAGVEVPKDSLTLAGDYFFNQYHESGGFGYTGPGNSPTLTPVGVLCEQFLRNGSDKRVRKCLDNMMKVKCDWDEAGGGFALYRWYYMTLAMFQGGEKTWTYWNKEMRDTLLKHQEEDGHWEIPAASDEPKYIGTTWVYSTTLCTLMLEVYYRYLPIYQLIDDPRHAATTPTMVTTPTLPTTPTTKP